VIRKSAESHAWLCDLAEAEPVKAAIMNPQRFAVVATLLAVVIAGCALVWLAGFGSADVDHIDPARVDHRALSLAADAEPADASQATAISKGAGAGTVEVARAEAATTTSVTAAQDRPESIAGAAPADTSPTPPETPPVQMATANPGDQLPDDARKDTGSVEIPGECGDEADLCIDQYLWALYQRTPKEDTLKVSEQRKVVVKKKHKKVTVVRSFTRLVDEDFAWKDPKAAEKAGMPMMAYVIGGMDRSFKLRLFHLLRAADEAGLSPGITSAFRDDYRQSLASGLKAATNRSYHGGSFRGGYGHGLAADVVSVRGETRDERYHSSETLWKWIDAHGAEFGIGRPYLDRDPPHVAPIDGVEYASHHGGTEARHDGSKKRSRLAARDHHKVAKRAKTAKSSRQRTI
jgi:hypothetical protein